MFNTTAECIIDSLMKKDNVVCNEKDLQLGTEYLFPEIGVRLWRERAFHLKLLKDPLYNGRDAGCIRRRISVSILPDGYCDGLNC